MHHILLGLFPWELQLPWAPLTLKYDAGARLERVDRGCGLACARGVIVSICRRVGTSVTVTTQTVSGKSVVGRRRARQATHRKDAAAKSRHAQAEKERRQRAKTAPKAVANVDLAPARGHAAEKFFLFQSVIGRVAMKPPWYRPVIRRATVVPPAVRPFAMYWIENASGSPATRWTAA